MSPEEMDLPMDPDPKLEQLLDGYAPRARAAFREELRTRFLSGEATRGDEPLDAELAAALDDHGDATPSARASFKDELRARFVGGAFADAQEDLPDLPELVVDDDDATEEPERAVRPVRRPRTTRPGARGRSSRRGRRDEEEAPPRRTGLKLVVGGLVSIAAAAVILVATGFFASPPPPYLTLAHATTPAGLKIDGETADMTAPDFMERLNRATSLGSGQDAVRLRIWDLAVVELGPGSELDLDSLDRTSYVLEGWRPDLDLGGKTGSFRIATSPRFKPAGASLSFASPNGDIDVVGTVFGVDLGEGYTCVCCLEGRVKVTPKTRDAGFPESSDVEQLHTYVMIEADEDQAFEIPDPHKAPLDVLTADLKSIFPAPVQ